MESGIPTSCGASPQYVSSTNASSGFTANRSSNSETSASAWLGVLTRDRWIKRSSRQHHRLALRMSREGSSLDNRRGALLVWIVCNIRMATTQYHLQIDQQSASVSCSDPDLKVVTTVQLDLDFNHAKVGSNGLRLVSASLVLHAGRLDSHAVERTVDEDHRNEDEANRQRRVSVAPCCALSETAKGTASNPNRVVNLMIGFNATEDVSLNGSPTVSPTTHAS